MTSNSIITLALFNFVFFSLAAARNYRSIGRVNYEAGTFRCPSEGFHADPNDCTTFYRCIDWNSNVFFRDFSEPALTAFQFICGEGTIFDPESNICSQPHQTSRRECGGRSMQDTNNNQFSFAYSSTGESDDGNPYQENSYQNYQFYEVSTHNPDHYPNEYENQIFPEVDPLESNAECTSEGFFPIPGNCNMFMRCTDDGMGGLKKFVFRCGEGTVWDQQNQVCNYPSAVPGCGGMSGNFPGNGQGYPDTSGSHNENNQYPDEGYPGQQGFSPQGNYPSQGSSPGTGSYPSQGYPGQGNRPPTFTYPGQENQAGYPGQPSQTGYPGSDPNQGGYPGQQPGQINNPEQYPHQGGYPEQNGPGSRPPPMGYPQQGSQGAYPGTANRPPSGGYPGQHGNRPDQTGNTQPTGYPDSYPNQSETGQSGFPGEGYPQGGYPGSNAPSQSQGYPGEGPEEYGDGNPVPTGNPNECQAEGFFSVPGDCIRFFRCVDNGKGGYIRYDFICGPGTVWDQESVTCNHPWAVQRMDCSVGATTESNADSSRSTSMQQQTTSDQNWSQSSSSSQTTSSFTNFTQSTSSSSSSSSSYFNSTSSSTSTQSQTSSSSSSSSQNQMNGSSQQGQGSSTSNQQGSQSSMNQQTGMQGQNGMTTPMGPESRPTTMRPQQEMTTASGNMSTSPPGSKPCQPDKNSPIKCEKAGFYAVPGNCKKFYRCADWDGDKGERFSVYYFECGDGTIWDPALETCNHEESVYPPRDCGGQSGEGSQSLPEKNTTESTTEKNTTDTTTEENTDTTESTTPEEMDETTKETSTNARPTSTNEPMGSTTPATDTEMSTMSPTDINEITTQSSSESISEQTSMTPESTDPTESATDGETNPTSQKPDGSNERVNETSTECPALGEGQVAFVCPTGFRRHPKDCNLFYQCTISKEGDVNVMTLSCKNDTVYDERKIQCLPPDETDPCPDKPKGRTRSYRKIEPEMTSVVPIATSKSLCPNEGHFPYQGDCQRFFKCQKDREGKMQGYLYQCPEKYSFSERSKICERSSALPKCSRHIQYLTSQNLKWMSSKVPIEYSR